jgi:hypothetical protein
VKINLLLAAEDISNICLDDEDALRKSSSDVATEESNNEVLCTRTNIEVVDLNSLSKDFLL